MTDISRRNFGLLAGASAALAACKPGGEGGPPGEPRADAETTSDSKFGLNFFNNGASEPQGSLDPYGAAPANYAKFTPEFIHIVHVQSPKPWLFDVQQAHFLIEDKDAADDPIRLRQCVGIMEERLKALQKDPASKFSDLSIKPVKEYLNADYFGYGSQHQIFIFIEGGSLIFNPAKLLSFKSKLSNGDTAEANHAFFKAELLTGASQIGVELARRGRIIRLNNHYTKPDGSQLGDKDEINYALNIHYGQPVAGEGKAVSMVFDPDTGNGHGNEP